MNSLCTVDSGLLGLSSGVINTAPTGFIVNNNSIAIPLDSDPDLILHYPFNNNILNYSGTNPLVGDNNATIVSSAVSISSNQSIFKNGSSLYQSTYNTNSYLSINNIPTNTGGYTFSFWIYLSNTQRGSIFSFADALNSSNRVALYQPDANTWSIFFFTSNISNFLTITSYLNTWTHFILTFSKANEFILYANGVNIYTNNTFTYNATSFVYNRIFGDTFGAEGKIANMNDFRYYNRVLDIYEIKQIYNITFPLNNDPTFGFYYPFNTDTLNYASGVGVDNAITLVITNTNYKVGRGSAKGPPGVYSGSNFSFTNTGGYSFSLWTYITTGSLYNNTQFFTCAGGNRGYNLFYNQTRYYLYGGISPSFITINLSNIIFDTWSHIAFTITTSGNLVYYFNGVLTATTPNTITYINPIGMGMYFNYYETVYMDDLRYYNRVLSQSDITQLYNYNNSLSPTFNLNSDLSLCIYYTFDISKNTVSNYAQNVYGVVDASYANGARVNYTDLTVGTGSLKLDSSISNTVSYTLSWATSTQGLYSPTAIAIDTTNNYIYVANMTGAASGTISKISIFNPTTVYTANWVSANLSRPYGLAIDSTKTYIYAANFENGRIYKIGLSNTGDNTLFKTVGGNLTGIVIDSANTYLYATIFSGNAVAKISITNPSGDYNASWATNTQGLSNPISVAIDDVYLYVSNNNANTISKILLSSPATFTANWANNATQGLNGPNGLFIDSTKTYLYVVNTGTNTVIQISLSTPANFKTYANTGIVNPVGIAIDFANFNNMYVVNNTGGTNTLGTITQIIPQYQNLTLLPNNVANTTNFISNTGMSFSFWIYSTSSNITPRTVFYFGNSSNDNLKCIIAATSISFIVVINSTTSTVLTLNTNYNNAWYYIVWTMSYSASNTSAWNIYVNSTSVSSTSANYYPNITKKNDSYLGKGYSGNIDDFRVYQRILTQSEITQLYNYTNTLKVKSANLSWNASTTTNTQLSYNYSYTDNNLNITGPYFSNLSGLQWKSFYGTVNDYTTIAGLTNSVSFQTNSQFSGGNNTLSSNSSNVLLNNINYSNNIASTGNIFGFTVDYWISLIITGYFVPNETGVWNFRFSANGFKNDDVSNFWIDDNNGNTWPPTDTNYNYTTYNSSAIYSSTTLTAGYYYPMQLSWSQSAGGSYLGFAFKGPSMGSYILNGSGYFFYSTSPPVNIPTTLNGFGLNWKAFYGIVNNDTTISVSPNFNSFQSISRYSGGSNTLSSTTSNLLTYIDYNVSTNKIAASGNIFGFSNTGSSGDYGDYISLILTGYFLPNKTGTWNFKFENSVFPNDDVTSFWINDAANVNGTTNHWPPSDTNYNLNYVYAVGSNIYTTTLTAGLYYQIQITWAQRSGNSGFGLQFQGPDMGSYIFNGTGYFFYQIDSPSSNVNINNLIEGDSITYQVNKQIGNKQYAYRKITK